MIGFEINIFETSRMLNDRFVFENENKYRISELVSIVASVNASDWEDKIYSNVSTAFAMSLSSDYHFTPISDFSFSMLQV